MERPTAQLPAPDLETASRDQGATASTGDRQAFSARKGPPRQGDPRLIADASTVSGESHVAAVEDAPTEAEAARAGAEVAPVPECGDGSAQQFSGLADGEQVGVV